MNPKLANLLVREIAGRHPRTRDQIRRRWSNLGTGMLFIVIVWALLLGTDAHGPFTWMAAWHLIGLIVSTIGCVWYFRVLRE